MSQEERKVKEMIKKLQSRKTELAELSGERKQIMKQLASEGCETLEDIESEIEKEKKKTVKLEEQVRAGLEELEADYDWE